MTSQKPFRIPVYSKAPMQKSKFHVVLESHAEIPTPCISTLKEKRGWEGSADEVPAEFPAPM